MWQIYANLFFYSFCYYAAKGPLADVSKDIEVPGFIDKLNANGILTTTLIGSLLLAFFQDKVGTRFAMNLSQLSSFLIYAIGLLKFDKEIVAAAGPGAADALKTVPSSAFLLIKVLPMLQHSMQLGTAGVVCLRPWDKPMIALGRVCFAMTSYAAGLYCGSLMVESLALKGAGALTLATTVAFFAWVMNYFTFPDRQRAPPAKPGTRVEDAGSYFAITLNNYKLFAGYLVMVTAAGVFSKYIGDQSDNTPKFLLALAAKLGGVKVEYLISPIIALLAIPFMSLFTKTPGGVIRFTFGVATLYVIWQALTTLKLLSPCPVCKDIDWVIAVTMSRVMYIVPSVYVMTGVMPGTQAQTLALSSGIFRGVSTKAVTILMVEGCEVVKAVTPAFASAVAPEAFLTILLLAAGIYATLQHDRYDRTKADREAAKLKKKNM